jgi:hypothetical protein
MYASLQSIAGATV